MNEEVNWLIKRMIREKEIKIAEIKEDIDKLSQLIFVIEKSEEEK